MNQHMTHVLNIRPRHLGMCITEFMSQLIYGLTYDFHLFYETMEQDFLLPQIVQCVIVTPLQQSCNRFADML